MNTSRGKACTNGPALYDARRKNKLYPKNKALTIARIALAKKAEDVVIIDIKKLSSVSDYIVIASAGSERQVEAIARAIEDGLREKGARPLGTEGAGAGRWALLDYDNVVAHVFLEPLRRHYDLDGLWADAPKTEVRDAARPHGGPARGQ